GRHKVPVAQVVHGDRGCGRALSDVLNALVRNASSFQGVELTDVTLQLVASALGIGGAGAADDCGPGPRGIGARGIARYIEARVHDTELTPQHIAAHFNISLRQLYRVVAAAGCTPGALIWKERLNHARSLLEVRRSRAPILEIALSCGFKDGAHFSRAY